MFPWTQSQWQRLTERAQQHALPHAILLSGPVGIGKGDFAIGFAQALVCEQPTVAFQACGQCRSCRQFVAHTHPDIIRITPEDDSRAIKIDQIRALRENLTLASHHAGYRIAIISPAETLNIASANSLLKTLEEPPAKTVLFLISHQPSLLPATIRSRCQRIEFHLPAALQVSEWLSTQVKGAGPQTVNQALAATFGAPLAARHWLESDSLAHEQASFEHFAAIGLRKANPLATAASWLKAEQSVPIQWIYRWLGDLLRVKSGLVSQVIDSTRINTLNKLAQQVNLTDLFALVSLLLQYVRSQAVALNQQLVYETILLRWAAITGQRGVR